MLPKIVHVIIIGLSEAERAALDEDTRRMLRFSDPQWQYTSYGCATLGDAVNMAFSMPKVDILFVARDTESGFATQKLKKASVLMARLQNHPSKPVLSYNDEKRDNKLAISIFALWRDRDAAQKRKP